VVPGVHEIPMKLLKCGGADHVEVIFHLFPNGEQMLSDCQKVQFVQSIQKVTN
jgi:hypothetical protein